MLRRRVRAVALVSNRRAGRALPVRQRVRPEDGDESAGQCGAAVVDRAGGPVERAVLGGWGAGSCAAERDGGDGAPHGAAGYL